MNRRLFVVKGMTTEYPFEIPITELEPDCYVDILQKESMSGLYPEATWLSEFSTISGDNIVIPWHSGETVCGFVLFESLDKARYYIINNLPLFPTTIAEFPEYLV